MLENDSYAGLSHGSRSRSPALGVAMYISTEPLSDIDLQASARAAVLIASYLANKDPFEYYYLASVRLVPRQ